MALERVNIANCPDRLQVALHRDRYDFVLAQLSAGQRVLEVGTGDGIFSKELLARCASYVGVEYDHATCVAARHNTEGKANIIEADARCLPFNKGEFSFVICLEVLEHLGDYQAGVKSIHHCLEPNGAAIFSVPYRRRGGSSKTNPYHLYEPGENELVSLLKQLFVDVRVYYQYFEETSWLTMARKLHLRRLLGLDRIYFDLTTGQPHATARLRIGQWPQGMKISLIVVAKAKKQPSLRLTA